MTTRPREENETSLNLSSAENTAVFDIIGPDCRVCFTNLNPQYKICSGAYLSKTLFLSELHATT